MDKNSGGYRNRIRTISLRDFQLNPGQVRFAFIIYKENVEKKLHEQNFTFNVISCMIKIHLIVIIFLKKRSIF